MARARLNSGDSRTVGRFGLSSVRSIPIGSREIFVNTALTRALSRQASSSSTDSADVPSPRELRGVHGERPLSSAVAATDVELGGRPAIRLDPSSRAFRPAHILYFHGG